jgi:hypothetical protein
MWKKMTMNLNPGPSPKLMMAVDDGKAIILLHKIGPVCSWYYTICFDTEYIKWNEVFA